MHDIIEKSYNGTTDIMIGMDNYCKFNLSKIIPHSSFQFGIIKSKSGWTISTKLALDKPLWKIQLNNQRMGNSMKKIAEVEASLKQLFNRDEELNTKST